MKGLWIPLLQLGPDQAEGELAVGKNQRSRGCTSLTKLFPSLSIAVIRAEPVSISAHSAALCQ